MDQKDFMKHFKLPDIQNTSFVNPVTQIQRQMDKQQENMGEMLAQITEQKARDRANLYEQTAYLREIRDNTAKITDLMDVLRINSNHQSEILEVIAEILVLSSSNSKEEVNSKFDGILDKLKMFKDNFELYEFLSNLLNGAFKYALMKLTGEA